MTIPAPPKLIDDPDAAMQLDAWQVALNRYFQNVINTLILGVAAGYKIARGQTTTTAASTLVDTGLSSVIAAIASLESDPVLACDRAAAVIGNQAGVPGAGRIYIKTWRPTAAGDATPIAATVFGKKVNWIAIGT